MDVMENSRETRRRVLELIGVTAVCGPVTFSAAVLAVRISSMMPADP